MLGRCEKPACLHSESACLSLGCCLLRGLGEAQTSGTLGLSRASPWMVLFWLLSDFPWQVSPGSV